MKKIMTARVSGLSVDELRFLIQETMRQTFEELFRDPERWADLNKTRL
jgi:predicted acetyltransferase